MAPSFGRQPPPKLGCTLHLTSGQCCNLQLTCKGAAQGLVAVLRRATLPIAGAQHHDLRTPSGGVLLHVAVGCVHGVGSIRKPPVAPHSVDATPEAEGAASQALRLARRLEAQPTLRGAPPRGIRRDRIGALAVLVVVRPRHHRPLLRGPALLRRYATRSRPFARARPATIGSPGVAPGCNGLNVRHDGVACRILRRSTYNDKPLSGGQVLDLHWLRGKHRHTRADGSCTCCPQVNMVWRLQEGTASLPQRDRCKT